LLVPYPYNGLEQLLTLFQNKPSVMHLFFTSSARFSSALLKHCAALAENEEEELERTSPEEMFEDEEENGNALEKDEESGDEPLEEEPDDELPSQLPDDYQEGEIPAQLVDAAGTILTYGGCDEELSKRFCSEIAAFRAMPDRNSTDDRDRAKRNALTNDFYAVYKKVFEASLKDDDLPAAVKLFLTFGFVDAGLAGAANSAYLLSIIDHYHGAPEEGIFTFYEWLCAIYNGDREPSRNEFDLDYGAYLREQKNAGKISPQQEKQMLSSKIDRVYFELENVFPLVNKMTFGRISTFCPVLSDHNLLKALSDTIVTPHRITSAINMIRSIDFSAYCRETTFADESRGIVREYLDIEVLPDVILMPNAGVRGAMWQEIEGKRRTTPSRMMLSAIALESVSQLLIRMTGEFRWEMCKRIQGAYWNNIAERSLTSEYMDYAQFYKKNHDLSPDAKEKIKLSLQKAKNSIKEMFVRDYVIWIVYEGKGSPHLNKIARTILFTYCPFSSKVREKLRQHPLYKDMLERYQLQVQQKLHHLDMLCTKIEKTGSDIPEEIERQREFLQS
ncbi:MAG: hypothetical protein J6C33_06365, partial [Lachnospiraceae bacterium]|nr:hypothetical protein [Lachnospiraceae bacterium]